MDEKVSKEKLLQRAHIVEGWIRVLDDRFEFEDLGQELAELRKAIDDAV